MRSKRASWLQNKRGFSQRTTAQNLDTAPRTGCIRIFREETNLGELPLLVAGWPWFDCSLSHLLMISAQLPQSVETPSSCFSSFNVQLPPFTAAMISRSEICLHRQIIMANSNKRRTFRSRTIIEMIMIVNNLYGFTTYETFQAASALCLKFSLYACMGVRCPSA